MDWSRSLNRKLRTSSQNEHLWIIIQMFKIIYHELWSNSYLLDPFIPHSWLFKRLLFWTLSNLTLFFGPLGIILSWVDCIYFFLWTLLFSFEWNGLHYILSIVAPSSVFQGLFSLVINALTISEVCWCYNLVFLLTVILLMVYNT